MFKRALPLTALVASFVLLPLVTARAQADAPAVAVSSCYAGTSALDAQAARLPRSVVRLSADSIRDVEQDTAGRPDNALLSVAVNVRNACGGEIVLPDLTVLTLDPQALRGDRLVRISQLPTKSYLVELSPPDSHYPTSLPARATPVSTRYGHEPAISLGYVLPGTTLPAHIAAQSYMATSEHHIAKTSQTVTTVAQASSKDSITPITYSTPTPAPKPTVMPVPVVATPAPIVGLFRTTANVHAATGGTITLENGVQIIIGARVLPADAAITLEFNTNITAPPTTDEYISAPGVVNVILNKPDTTSPVAPASTEPDFNGAGVRLVMHRPAKMTGDNLGLASIRACYRNLGQDEQQVSSLQSHGDDIAADFASTILQSHALGKRVWFSLQQYNASTNF